MKTLIVYSTNHGTAKKAANILKSKLPGEVHTVNILLKSVSSLEEYDIIIIGGSSYVGKTQQKLSSFVHNNKPLLLKKRIGLFLCASKHDSASKEKLLIEAFSSVIFEHAISKDVFEFDVNKLNFIQKFITSKIKCVKISMYKLSKKPIYDFAEMVKING